MWAYNRMHEEFHIPDSWIDRHPSLVRARRIHEAHHDLDSNFAFLDHFWDKVFGTFYLPEEP